ncbi:MAG TPA: cytidylate kinase-like family protein [Thermoguttaceae bacterium]|nr:cytidylate kinase-like family protein [Thermoguttaceae bacterium]
MKGQIREEPKIVAAAERRMQAWDHIQEIEERALREHEVKRLSEGVCTYVTVSREEGAGGGEIARGVGKKLNWEVFDKNLLDRVSQRYHLSHPMLKLVDEVRSNWVHDVLGTWMDRQVVPPEKYVACLRGVVLTAARHGHVVLVGRGAQFLLPRDKGLAVRIIAPKKFRIERTMQEKGLDAEAARRLIENTDQNRREFVRRYFHHDVDDPHLFDLVINVERIGVPGAVAQIVSALQTTYKVSSS